MSPRKKKEDSAVVESKEKKAAAETTSEVNEVKEANEVNQSEVQEPTTVVSENNTDTKSDVKGENASDGSAQEASEKKPKKEKGRTSKKKKPSKSSEEKSVENTEDTTVKATENKEKITEEFDTTSKIFTPNIYHEDSDELIETKSQKYSALKRFSVAELPLPLRLTTFEIINDKLYFKGKLPEPYSYFDIYLDVKKEFFLVSEIAQGKKIEKRGIKELQDLTKHYLFATVNVCLTRLIEHSHTGQYTIFASRVKGMEKLEHINYVTGIFNRKTRKKQKIHDNMIVQNCNIIRVTNACIEVEVAGVPATIGKNELSYDYINDPNDYFSVGDYIDVYIKKINYKKDVKTDKEYRLLECSVKRTKPNPTIPALHKALEQRQISTGIVVGARQDAVGYYIKSFDGYNVYSTTITREKRVADMLGNSSLGKKPVIGSIVSYKPIGLYTQDNEVMFARITRVIRQ